MEAFNLLRGKERPEIDCLPRAPGIVARQSRRGPPGLSLAPVALLIDDERQALEHPRRAGVPEVPGVSSPSTDVGARVLELAAPDGLEVESPQQQILHAPPPFTLDTRPLMQNHAHRHRPPDSACFSSSFPRSFNATLE